MKIHLAGSNRALVPQRWRVLYAFTTENISGYLPLVGPAAGHRFDTVLTVCGSGDQLLNAILLGATELTAFDINPAAGYWLELKSRAVELFNFGEYQRFFLRFTVSRPELNREALSWRQYSRLRPDLSEMSRNYFDNLYRQYHWDGAVIRNCAQFHNLYDRNELKLRSNLYLCREESYETLRTSQKKAVVTFYSSSLADLAAVLRSSAERKMFDAILLSNIADYAAQAFPSTSSYLDCFVKKCLLPLLANLAPGGTLLAAYVYRTGPTPRKPRSDIDRPEARTAALQGLNYEEISIPSVQPAEQDLVVLVHGYAASSKAEYNCLSQ